MKIRGYGSEINVTSIAGMWVYAETRYTFVNGSRIGPVYLTPCGARRLAKALVRLAGRIEKKGAKP